MTSARRGVPRRKPGMVETSSCNTASALHLVSHRMRYLFTTPPCLKLRPLLFRALITMATSGQK